MRRTTSLFNRMVPISLALTGYPNFQKIDRRIIHDGCYRESYPMQTRIKVPEGCSKEIIARLKLYPGISLVNGERAKYFRDAASKPKTPVDLLNEFVTYYYLFSNASLYFSAVLLLSVAAVSFRNAKFNQNQMETDNSGKSSPNP